VNSSGQVSVRKAGEAAVGSPATLPGFEAVRFQADSALLRELGERLVGQPHIALAELIKNSYDADATLCTIALEQDSITVTDNGHGMTRAEFLEHWMTIGTRNKQERVTSREFARSVTGSKGVGRLSAQFLAHELEIITSPKTDSDEQLHALVDWDEAIEAGLLSEAQAFYRVEPRTTLYPEGSQHGTRVVMKRLKQGWNEDRIKDLGRQLWMIQSPLGQYGRLTTGSVDPNAFRVELSSWSGDLADTFTQQMAAALRNYDAVISGEMTRNGNASSVHVKVTFSDGEIFSESFEVKPLVEVAKWMIRVFKLQGRQVEGIKVADARGYFERFGGVQVYDAGFRLPYYGVEQDWLRIEFDHSHRRGRSSLLPERLQVRRALNDLPTQGRLFGIVAVNTGKEARAAREREQDSGEYLKIQVTRDRLVANEAYTVLRDAVRWSLDYYATRQRLREESSLSRKRPEEQSGDKIGRIRDLVLQVRQEHPEDENALVLEREILDLSQNLEDEQHADEAARALLGPLASAGMAALALEHESRKELRSGRGLLRRLRRVAKETDDPRIVEITDDLAGWMERLESTRRVFAPLLDADDREQVEAFSLKSVLRQVVENVAPLMPGISARVGVPGDIVLPPATFAEWTSLFQNVLLNAANAMLDSDDRRIFCSGGRTGRAAWARVSDSGSGIDWHRSNEFFEPFARELNISEERRSLGLGGMGLGLTIVRMIADQRRCKVGFIEPEPLWATTFQLSWSSSS
jgi:signal transduction histidine kinase